MKNFSVFPPSSVMRAAILVVMSLILMSCSDEPWDIEVEEFSFRVVDDSGDPLEDVLVILNYRVVSGGHGTTIGRIKVDHAFTDKEGMVRFPEWSKSNQRYIFGPNEPTIYLIKKGYYRLSAHSTSRQLKKDNKLEVTAISFSGESELVMQRCPYDEKECNVMLLETLSLSSIRESEGLGDAEEIAARLKKQVMGDQ